MDDQEPNVSAGLGSLNLEALFEFIDELRETGYNIGVSQYVAAQDLILALIASGEDVSCFRRFGSLLGPILCSSPLEQKDFQGHLERWATRIGLISTPKPRQDVEITTVKKELDRIAQQPRRWQRVGWAVVVALALVVAVVFPSILPSLSTPAPTLTFTSTPTLISTPIPTFAFTSTPTLISTPMSTFVLTPAPTFAFTSTPKPISTHMPTFVLSPAPTLISSTPTLTPAAGEPLNLWKLWKSSPSARAGFGLFLLVPSLVLLAWRLWWFYRINHFLARYATSRQPDIARLSVPVSRSTDSLFPTLLFLRISQKLRQRIAVPSNKLDVNETIRRTIRCGGWFVPAYAPRRILPEYLVMIDRARYGDHQARLIDEMLAHLWENKVFVTIYYFDSDPRICFPMTPGEPPQTLFQLASKYAQYRLLIFSDAEGLFNPLDGTLETWTRLFKVWEERALLTPESTGRWGYRERELSEHFVILPATTKGLNNLVSSLKRRELPDGLTGGGLFPEELRMRPRYWIERNPPQTERTKRVLESVQRFLGEEGYYWLSACAVYPEIHWELTLHLGNALFPEKQYKSLLPKWLAAMARLPWLRYSYMPDWLRIHLISGLSCEQERRVRSILEALLLKDVTSQSGSLQLQIARTQERAFSVLAKRLLRQLFRRVEKESPLRDHIFMRFMLGRRQRRLAIRLPLALQRWIDTARLKIGRKVAWPRVAVLLLMALLLVAVGVLIYIWTISPLWPQPTQTMVTTHASTSTSIATTPVLPSLISPTSTGAIPARLTLTNSPPVITTTTYQLTHTPVRTAAPTLMLSPTLPTTPQLTYMPARTVMPTSVLSPIPTTTPQPIYTLTRTATPMPTQTPQAVQPEPMSPAWGETCRNPVTFLWSGSLNEGETYQITLYHAGNDTAQTESTIQSGMLPSQEWTTALSDVRYGEWHWTVSVVREGRQVVASPDRMFWFQPRDWPTPIPTKPLPP